MSEPIGEAFVRVRGETSGFKQSAQPGIVSSTKSLALTAAKTFGLVFGAEKIFHFGADAISEAALTQKATENIKAQFGSAANDVLRFSDTAASSFGISKHASEDFSSSIGLVGKNLGLGKRETADMAVGLQKLSGSVGLIKGQDPAGYFDKLKLALLGNTRGLKSMGISLDTTTISQYALDHGLVKATVDHAKVADQLAKSKAAQDAYTKAVSTYGVHSKEAEAALIQNRLAHESLNKALEGTVPKLTAAQKAQAIYGLATQKLGSFMTQARQHTGDWADEQIKLKAELSNVKEEIGAFLLPQLAKLGAILLGDVIPAISATVGEIKSFINAIPADVLKGIALGIGVVAAAWGIYTVAQYAAATALAVMNAAFSISPIGLLVIAIVGLVAGLYILYERFHVVRTIVQSVFGFISTYVPTVLHAMLSVVLFVFGAVRGYIQGAMTVIRGIINVVLGVIHGNWSQVWSGLGQIVSGALHAVSALLGGLPKMVLGQIQKIPGALGNLGRILYNAGVSIISGLLDGLKSKFHDVTSFVGGIANSISSLKGPIEYDRTLLIPHGKAIMAGLHDGLSSGLADNLALVGGVAGKIQARVIAGSLPAPGAALAGAGGVGNSSALLSALGSPRAASDQSVHIEHLTVVHPDPHAVLRAVLNEVAARRHR